MEARKILFVMNNSSGQKSIMSEAETLGALKADMRKSNINYDNMAFFEGRTRTELKDDASVLPTNVPVAAKGTTPATTTNDLVFMLTTANKKIRSGALGNERKEVMESLKAAGLSAAVTARFGKNMTQCKTPDLIAFLAENSTTTAQPKAAKTKSKVEKPKVDNIPVTGNSTVIIRNSGNDKLKVVKIVKESLNTGLKEAKDIVEGTPSRIQGLTEEVAAKFVSDLIGVGADASIEGQDSALASVAPVQACTVVDVKARVILKRILEALVEEDELYGDYSDILSELDQEDEKTEKTVAPATEAVQHSPKKEDDTLSKAEVDSLFGDWVK